MNDEEGALAKDIAKYGAAAADALVGMLDSTDAETYQLITYCLFSLKKEDFRPRHLEPMAIAASRRRDWLPNAIADIDTDEAAEFLARDFRRAPQTMAQIDNALERMAPRSIPPLLSEFRRASEDESGFLQGLTAVFSDCGPRASSAVEPLTTIALDSSQPAFRRKAAIKYLGAIGPPSQKSFPELRALAGREAGQFALVIEDAIAGSRTSDAADLLIDKAIDEARTKGETNYFREIATEIGPAGSHLAGRLVELLDNRDANVRLGACRTLGYLGKIDVWPHLGRMLKAEDWRIAHSAALSLTQLGAEGGRPLLESCRENHWYPRVRHVADYALRRLAGGDATEIDSKRLGPATHGAKLEAAFDSYDWKDEFLKPLDDLSHLALPVRKEKPESILYFARPENEEYAKVLEAMEGGRRTLEISHSDIYRAILAGAPEAVEQWKRLERFGPRVIAMVEEADTTVVAIAAGEWHGGIFVVKKGEPAKLVYGGFIRFMFRWNREIVVLSGLTHMGIDQGAVYRIAPDGDGWQARFLYALPGCPQFGCVLADGRLLANCMGGAVAITPDGEFEYLGSGKVRVVDPAGPKLPE